MKKILFLVSMLLLNHSVQSETLFDVKSIATGLGTPWGMVELPSNQLLVSQRPAQLSLINLTFGNIDTIAGLPAVKVEGQGGLFDVAISPNYPNDPWLYFSYNKDINGQGATTLARTQLKGKKLTQWQDIFISQSRTDNKVHYGGRITFDNDGHVFLSIGDRGVRSNGQNLLNHAGKIIRLNLDGTVPADNPFIDNDAALAEIWSYGHRNPQGLFFNPDTGLLWAIEHGPRGGDEINLIKAGKNYGWPVISHGMEYWGPFAVGKGTERDDIEPAVKVYIPSIAPSSLIQYRGNAFSKWKGNLLAGAMKLQHINRVVLDLDNKAVTEQRIAQSLNARIRNIIESDQGWLYIATDNGHILQLSPKVQTNSEPQ